MRVDELLSHLDGVRRSGRGAAAATGFGGLRKVLRDEL